MRTALWIAAVGVLLLLGITGRSFERSFTFRLLIYIDMFFCAAILGDADMTISARCGIALRAGHPWPLCWLGRMLNVAVKNHCEHAILDDMARARAALSYLSED